MSLPESFLNNIQERFEPLTSKLTELDQLQSEALSLLTSEVSPSDGDTVSLSRKHEISETFSKIPVYRDRIQGLVKLMNSVNKKMESIETRVVTIQNEQAKFESS
ncbi:hypothetical protein GEMRC1_000133 [Eukaryota sp. GEM-RC1]